MESQNTVSLGGSWWWDPWIRSQSNISWVCSTNEKSGWDSMKENSWSKIHQVTGFVFILWCYFFNIFPLRLFIFIWNMEYFFIVKVTVAWSQQVKFSKLLPHDVTVNTHCDMTMVRWCCVGNYVMSQCIGDVAIDTKQSCDKQLQSFTQDPGFLGSFAQDPGGRKTWICYLNNWM